MTALQQARADRRVARDKVARREKTIARLRRELVNLEFQEREADRRIRELTTGRV
jgi:hypothetical protein